jgi:hypothetical protein
MPRTAESAGDPPSWGAPPWPARGPRRTNQHAVAAILDVRNNTLHTRRQRVIGVVVDDLALGPESAFDVEDVPSLILVLSPTPAQIHAPQRGGVAVDDGGEWLTVFGNNLGLTSRHGSTPASKAEACLEFVTEPEALLLVGVDPVAAPRRYVLHPEQVLVRWWEA